MLEDKIEEGIIGLLILILFILLVAGGTWLWFNGHYTPSMIAAASIFLGLIMNIR